MQRGRTPTADGRRWAFGRCHKLRLRHQHFAALRQGLLRRLRNSCLPRRPGNLPINSPHSGTGDRRCFTIRLVFSICPGGEIGRRKGLKILFPATEVRVQFPPRAPINLGGAGQGPHAHLTQRGSANRSAENRPREPMRKLIAAIRTAQILRFALGCAHVQFFALCVSGCSSIEVRS